MLLRAVWMAALAAGAAWPQELRLRVASEGRPAAARVYISDAGGAFHRIPNTPGTSRRREVHSLVDGGAALKLPPGRYTVRAEKGAEFGIAEKTVDLASGAATDVSLDVPRLHSMNSRGWYSGDLHIHRDPGEMELALRVEELNVAPVITRHVGNSRAKAPPRARLPMRHAGPAWIASFDNQEVERLRKGHGAVVLLNTPEPVPGGLAELFPMDVEFARQARAQGGFVDAEKPIWKNFPVNVALGVVDSVGVVNNHFHPNGMLLDAELYGSMERDRPVYRTVAGFAQWMLDLYYSFLNCGFRLPASAGSASGIMPSWPGYERVYVWLGARFDYRAWFDALKAGRSIATNGPLLEVYGNGKPPGAESEWRKSSRIELKISARTQGRLERVEVVFNGEAIRVERPDAAAFETTIDLSVPGPGWLAVRCFEPAGATVRYAHSSPFYFTSGGKLPAKRTDAERWAGYISRMAGSLTPADYPSPEAWQKAQATFQEAESVYRRLADR